MKKLMVLCLVLMVSAWAGICLAGSTVIVNGLDDMEISEVYLSRASTDSWEDDLLGDEVLAPGDAVEVQFHPAENECEWDLMAVDEAGTEVVWNDLNLCGVGKITLQEGGVAKLE